MFKVINRLVFFSMLIVLLFLGGCSKEEVLFDGETMPNKEVLLELKNPFQISHEDVSSLIDPNQSDLKFIEILEEQGYSKRYSPARVIKKEEAEEDIDLYFKVLKSSYAGYLPNGGYERFNTAKEDIKADLKDEIKARDLKEIIKSHMAFVEDAHFQIVDEDDESELVAWYKARSVDIGKDNKGYFNISNKKYIKNKDEIESLLRPSLSEEQVLCYNIFSQSMSQTPKDIIYEDGTFEELKFIPINSRPRHEEDMIFEEIDKIAYFKLPTFYFPHEADKVNKAIEAVREMSNSNYSILDLRGNPGGDGLLVGKLFKDYTGEEVCYSSNTIIMISQESVEGAENSNNIGTLEGFAEDMKFETFGDNHIITKSSDETIEKDGLLIVLTDTSTMSAAEWLVDALHHVSNTVFIGMPTRGAANGSMVGGYRMRNSGILYTFGNMWSVYDEEYFQENRGFLPDLWLSDIELEGLVELLNIMD